MSHIDLVFCIKINFARLKKTYILSKYILRLFSISRFDELYISCMSADKVESNKKSIDFEIEKFHVLNFSFLMKEKKFKLTSGIMN